MNVIKAAIATKLAGDTTLTTKLGAANVFYWHFPGEFDFAAGSCVTYHLVTESIEVDVPLYDGIYQVDVWSLSGQTADEAAERVDALLHKQAITITGTTRVVALLRFSAIEDFEEDTRLHHRAYQYRVLSYPQ